MILCTKLDYCLGGPGLSKRTVIHSENCKVEIPLDITPQQLSNSRMIGIYEASRKRGFTDCSTLGRTRNK